MTIFVNTICLILTIQKEKAVNAKKRNGFLKVLNPYSSIKRGLHHLSKGGLSFLCGGSHARKDLVADSKDAEGALTGLCGVHIQCGALHLNAQNVHCCKTRRRIGVVGVERIA